MTIEELKKKLKEIDEALDGLLDRIIEHQATIQELRNDLDKHVREADAHHPAMVSRNKK